MNETTRSLVICALDDLADPGARGFRLADNEPEDEYFLVRRGGEVHAYQNLCPHAGSALNWGPDEFLSLDGQLILCSMHGAIFDIAGGGCLGGPCHGQSLTSLRCEVQDGQVRVWPPD
ncbi:MAG: Rieske (2Fe-2S) protein [Gammaproteobacteria bacterium]|jgi:nitrite reductase/ring-hydroxylating ferredoxin subunit